MSKISHYFKRRKAIKLFADRFLFEAPRPQPLAPPQDTIVRGQAPNYPMAAQQQPLPPGVTSAPQAPAVPLSPQPPIQPQAPVAPVGGTQPAPTPMRDEIIRTLEPINQAKMDVLNRRLT
jgi:hypothetical protein